MGLIDMQVTQAIVRVTKPEAAAKIAAWVNENFLHACAVASGDTVVITGSPTGLGNSDIFPLLQRLNARLESIAERGHE